MKHWLYPVLFILLSNLTFSQTDSLYVDQKYDGLQWSTFIGKIEQDRGISIFHHPDSLPNQSVHIEKDSISFETLLSSSLGPYGFRVYSDKKGNYFVYKHLQLTTSLGKDFFELARQTHPLVSSDTSRKREEGKNYLKTYGEYVTEKVTFGTKSNGNGGSQVVLSGFVTNADDGEPIPQATLHIKEENQYSATDAFGFYSIELERGQYTLSIKSIGSQEKKYRINIYEDGQLNISLDTKNYMIDEAVVTASRHDNVRATQMGIEKLDTKDIKQMPVVMGEQDIVKVALMLPGVQSVSEASAGFNVRGSPSDQNMFYINNLPIYNVTHLFGMFTAFNSDAVDEFSLYKSSIPADYGGRLSSIFDIQAKQGNMKEFSARGGISPVTSRIMVEGPIKKDTSSYLIGLRSTYSDWVLDQIKEVSISNSSAHFADALVNLDHKLGSRDHLSLFAYGSEDYADLTIGLENQYSNAGASLQWKHHYSKRHRSTLSLIHSNYHFREVQDDISYSSSKQSFNLGHSEIKMEFNYNPDEHHNIKYGINGVLYRVHQGDFLPLNESSNLKPLSFEPERGLRASLFASDEWEINPALTVKAGIRATQYNYLGPKTVYSYPSREPRIIENIIDTTQYSKGEPISTHYGVDYRLSAKYMINEEFSVKAGYNRLHQYIYQLSNTLSASPTDQWKLADKHIQPMEGSQYSMGIYKNFSRFNLEASIEGYYKTVDHLVEIKDGANLMYSKVPETDIIQGDLKAYGIELMLRKTSGKLNGWINYTYSGTSVKAVNSRTGESNNLGFSYPANYDKPHALNLTLNYKLTKRWSFSTNVVYSTGRPITYPKSIYYQNGMQITGFSRRNESRLPDYFRTDLSINYEGNLKKNKFAHGSWSLSFYNLTGRSNPYSVYFTNEDGKIQGYQLSIFGTVIPSITYNLKLGNYED